MKRDKEIVSITLSKEVVEKLNLFKNRSKLVDDILASVLSDLTKEEVFRLLMNDEDVASYLIKKKCKELNRGRLVGRGGLNRGRLVKRGIVANRSIPKRV